MDVKGGGGFCLVLLENGILFAMGHKDRCGFAFNSEDFCTPVSVQIGCNDLVQTICCSWGCAIVETANGKWFGFGDASAQKSPAYGKEISKTPSRIDDIFPCNFSVRKLTATAYCFFILLDNGDLYSIGNGKNGEMGIKDAAEYSSWILCKSNVTDVQTGFWNSFVFV